MFSLIRASINDSVNNREAGDLRRHRAHNDVTAMITSKHLLRFLRFLRLYVYFCGVYRVTG